MAFHGYVTPKGMNKIIDRDQTGSVPGMTLEEQIEFYDGEIAKAKNWVEYYKAPRQARRYSKESIAKLVKVHTETAERFAMKREIALAYYYASLMPDIGGCIELDGLK